MNLELLVGPYRSGKSSIAVKEALEFCCENPLADSVIITPSARYRVIAEESVRKAAQIDPAFSKGIMGLRFETFYAFVKRHSIASGAPAMVVSNRLRNVLLAHVLETLNARNSIPHLGSIAQMKGTAPAVLALLDEFQRATYSPDEVLAALNPQSAEDARHLELARIYQSYSEELKKRGCTDEKFQSIELCRLLSEISQEKKKRGAQSEFRYGLVVFDGFDRYSRVHARLAYGLAGCSQKVLLLFDYEPGSADYAWKENSYNMLLKEIPAMPRIVPARAHQRPSFDLFSSLDRFTEMQEIARQVKRLVVDKQATLPQILVTARHMRSYHGAAATAFEDFGIPYFLDRPYSANTLPVTQFVQALLGLHVNKFLRQDVIAVLRSRFFDASKHGLTRDDIDTIDRESLKAYVLKGHADWDRYLSTGRNTAGGGSINASDSADLQANMAKLNSIFDALTPDVTAKSFASHCRWCEDKLALFADFTLANVPDYNTGSCLALLRAVFATLIEEERVLNSEPVDYATFYERLIQSLKESDFRSRAAGSECVTICGAELVPNRTYKFVFIAGMLEGEFPAKDRNFNFAGRDRLESWQRRGIKLDNPRTHPGYEDALLKTITNSASDKVFMSYPRYDAKSKDREELLPSFALRSFFDDPNPRYVSAFEDALELPCSAKDATSGVLWRAPETNIGALLEVIPDQSAYLSSVDSCIAPSRTRLSATRESCFNGYLVDLVEAGALSIRVPKTFSATSLDHYGQCPFQFWATDVLKVRERQEIDTDNQYRLIGNFYHYVLENFYNRLIDDNVSINEDNRAQLKIFFDAAVSDGLNWLEDNAEFHTDEFWVYRKKYLCLLLDRFFEHELSLFRSQAQGFKPALCEASFGEGRRFPPLEVNTGDHTITVTGKIDRIDLNREKKYARIVDYKRSTRNLSVGAVRSAQAIQLPLYCLAAGELICPGYRVSRTEYSVVNAAESKAVDGASSIEDATQNARDRIKQYDADIRLGNFLVSPSHPSYCGSCPQRKVCRIAELPAIEEVNYAD